MSRLNHHAVSRPSLLHKAVAGEGACGPSVLSFLPAPLWCLWFFSGLESRESEGKERKALLSLGWTLKAGTSGWGWQMVAVNSLLAGAFWFFRGFLLVSLLFFVGGTCWVHMGSCSPTSAHTASPALGMLSLNPWIGRDVPDFLALTVPWAQRARYPFLVAICDAVFTGRSGLWPFTWGPRAPAGGPVRLRGCLAGPSCIRHCFPPPPGLGQLHAAAPSGLAVELLLLECRGGSEPSSSLREGPILLKRPSTTALKSPSLAALAAQWERARLPMWETRDVGSVPGSGRSPGERNGNPLQYPCLGNATDRGAWRAAVPGPTESQARLSD